MRYLSTSERKPDPRGSSFNDSVISVTRTFYKPVEIRSYRRRRMRVGINIQGLCILGRVWPVMKPQRRRMKWTTSLKNHEQLLNVVLHRYSPGVTRCRRVAPNSLMSLWWLCDWAAKVSDPPSLRVSRKDWSSHLGKKTRETTWHFIS